MNRLLPSFHLYLAYTAKDREGTDLLSLSPLILDPILSTSPPYSSHSISSPPPSSPPSTTAQYDAHQVFLTTPLHPSKLTAAHSLRLHPLHVLKGGKNGFGVNLRSMGGKINRPGTGSTVDA